MQKKNYKGRCEKRKIEKCAEICRTYAPIQSVCADMLVTVHRYRRSGDRVFRVLEVRENSAD